MMVALRAAIYAEPASEAWLFERRFVFAGMARSYITIFMRAKM
jgi:hypothetical protein